jgi:hypothetical protein
MASGMLYSGNILWQTISSQNSRPKEGSINALQFQYDGQKLEEDRHCFHYFFHECKPGTAFM